MKKLIAIIGLALSACATLPTTVPVIVNQPVGQLTVMDEKAMYAAEVAYNVPAQAYVSASKRGILTAAQKAALKPRLQQAYGWLLEARTAYRLGNAATFQAKVSALQAFYNQIMPLIPHS